MSVIPVRAPRVLGEFVLGEKLGEGGFGTVYRAEQRPLGRPAVVKVMRGSAGLRPEAVERFQREARLASQFDHPYAAHVYAFGAEPGGELWIAMELVRGTPLDKLIATGALPVERFVSLLERLCEAVQTAHDQGIVHRDIKPANVMVIARAGRLLPKLLDFGIAKLMAGESPPSSPRPAAVASSVMELELERTADASLPGAISRSGSYTASGSGSLTSRDQILGSPHYMAPEQWEDATHVGPWTDQYALGLLAFEALTGQRAFVGAIGELVERHLHDPLPPLPARLPPALYAVLARATAKHADERFPTVTAFAAAVRAAVDPGEYRPVPNLPPQVRAAWSGDAPQPIAEAIAALGAARSAAQVVDRVGAVAAVLARWLGVVALACRSRSGPLDPTAGAADVELVRELRRRALRDAEWLALARAVIAPFVDHPATWPIPEMVTALAPGGPAAALDALLRRDPALVVIHDDLEHVSRTATERIAALEAALAGLTWLLDYDVARVTTQGFELWTGMPADERVIRRCSLREPRGRVVILDGDGAPVVAISPLVHTAAPAPGDADELFLFAGPGRTSGTGAFCSYPRGFERENDAIWGWLAEHVLPARESSTGTDADDDRPPYPGLAAFTARDHAWFFGREREVEELVNRLRLQPIVAIVGPSGVGKTSFVAAGVVPALPSGWRAEVVRPGADPLAALRSAIERIAIAPYRDSPREPWPAAPVEIAQRLVRAADELGTTLVVIVDQAEELFTMCSADAPRTAFAEALAAAAGRSVRVAVVMRDDFLCRVEQLSPWGDRLGRAIHILKVPGREQLTRIVTLPAARRGYDFDDPTLPAAIVDDVVDRPAALPLLGFATARLWDERDRHFHRLTRAAYERIGGVTGALARHADGVIDRLSVADRRLARLAFRRLITTDRARACVGRAELVAAIGGDRAAADVVDRLIAARLVVSRDDEAGDRVELVHEALVAVWPRLAAWQGEDAAGAKLQEQLAAGARLWEERGRPQDLLWRGDALVDLRRWRVHADHVASPLEDAFVRASEHAARRTRQRRVAAVASVFAVLLSVVIGLWWANRRIGAQRADAVARLAANLEDRGRQAAVDGDASLALLYLAEAGRLGARGPTHDLLVSRAAAPVHAQVGLVARHPAPLQYGALEAGRVLTLSADGPAHVYAVADGRLVATSGAGRAADAALAGDWLVSIAPTGQLGAADLASGRTWSREDAAPPTRGLRVVASTAADAILTFRMFEPGGARLWDLGDGHSIGELPRDASVWAAAFDAQGRRVATGDRSGTIRIWNAGTAAPIATCAGGTDALAAIRFVPDGSSVVSAGDAGDVRVCDAATGAAIHRLVGHRTAVLSIDVSPDGRRLVSASRDGTARVWDLAGGEVVAVIEDRGVVRAQFARDGRRVVTAGADGTARIWDAESGLPLASLQGPTASLLVAELLDDGRRAVTVSADGAIRSWDVDRATRELPLEGNAGRILDLDLAATDQWAITAGARGAIVWERTTHAVARRLDGGGAIESVRFSPDHRAAITTGERGAEIWALPEAAVRTQLVGHDGAVHVGVFSPDGRTVATGGEDRTIRWWARDGAMLGSVRVSVAVFELSFDATGTRLIAEDADHAVVVDLATRTVIARLPSRGAIYAIEVHGNEVAVASGAVDVWDLDAGTRIRTLEGHDARQIRFLPDGRLVARGQYETRVWGADGRLAASLPSAGNRSFSLDATRDGSFVAIGHADGRVGLWDMAKYRLVASLVGHRGPVAAVRFTSDGQHLLSASWDGRVVEWDLRRSAMPASELAELVRCRVPLRLAGDVALPREIDEACNPP